MSREYTHVSTCKHVSCWQAIMGRQVLQVTCFWIIIVDVSEENEHDDEDNEEHATIVRTLYFLVVFLASEMLDLKDYKKSREIKSIS